MIDKSWVIATVKAEGHSLARQSHNSVNVLHAVREIGKKTAQLFVPLQ